MEGYIQIFYKIRFILEELYVAVMWIISQLITYIDQMNAAHVKISFNLKKKYLLEQSLPKYPTLHKHFPSSLHVPWSLHSIFLLHRTNHVWSNKKITRIYKFLKNAVPVHVCLKLQQYIFNSGGGIVQSFNFLEIYWTAKMHNYFFIAITLVTQGIFNVNRKFHEKMKVDYHSQILCRFQKSK